MKFIKFFTGTLIALVFYSQITLACTCIGESTLKREFQNRNLIIKGRIQRIDTIEMISRDTLIDIKVKAERILVDVDYAFKGRVKTKSIFIYTGLGNGDCGYQFEINEVYIIFLDNVKCILSGKLNGIKRYLYTDICYGTSKWSFSLDQILKAYK